MNWIKIIAAIAGIALIGFMVFQLKNNKEIAAERIYEYDKTDTLHVKADTLKLDLIYDESSFTGSFSANKESRISSELQGKVNSVLVDEGSRVRKGQTLVELDNSLLKLQLQSAVVQIEGLQADVKRYQVLSEAEAVQGVRLEKALLGLKSAEIQKASLEEQIRKTTIRAPFSGIITAKMTEIGAFAAPGVPLLQISDLANLRFTVQVPESKLKEFDLGRAYRISADAYAELPLKAKSSVIGSKANAGNSFPVQFELSNTEELSIKAGMFGKVYLNSAERDSVILIPASAILNSEEQPQVYLVKNGKAVLREIAVEKRIRNKAVIGSGLKSGDVLITKGFSQLFDGATISAH